MTATQPTAVIVLGGKEFTIEVPTFDDLQTMLPALDRMVKETGTVSRLEAAREIIAAAMSKSAEEIGDLRASLPEILDAIPVILKLTGLEELGKRTAAGSA